MLDAIEEGVRNDVIDYVVATTSLTEGINLPVRTVILHETTYPGQATDPLLRGARLLNAIGRAGRACRECEGWVVLALNKRESGNDFDLLDVGDDEIEVHSQLATTETLEALSALESACREYDDALFEAGAKKARDFVAFAWFVLSSEEARGHDPTSADLIGAVESTLAYAEMSEDGRGILRLLSEAVRRAYSTSDATRRRAWAMSGTCIGSARQIDEIANNLASEIQAGAEAEDVDDALSLVDSTGVLERLALLPECPAPWAFRRSRSVRLDVEVDVVAVLRDWVHGCALSVLAERYLAGIPSPEYRIEQMVDAVTQRFEHYYAWMLGSIVERVNDLLDGTEVEGRLCRALPLFIRFGVDLIQALEVLTAGVRSRELADRIGDQAVEAGIEPSEVRLWIASMSIGEWRGRFSSNPSDLRDLLEYARDRRGGFLYEFLESGTVTFSVDVEMSSEMSGGIEVRAEEGPMPQELTIRTAQGSNLGRVPPGCQSEVQAIIDTGLELEYALTDGSLTISSTLDS